LQKDEYLQIMCHVKSQKSADLANFLILLQS